jgi:hypothetical protein
MKLTHLQRDLLPILLIVIAGLILGVHCLLFGFPFYADDSITQVVSYSQFLEQLTHGDPYPRWLPKMNGGLGSAHFFYYSPAAYYLTTPLKFIFTADANGWRQLGLGAVLALIASGLAIYWWLKPQAGHRPALAAAIIYMALPYHLNLDLYARGAYAELWGFVLMPLLLTSVDRVIDGKRWAVPCLSLVYALMILTHMPTTLLFSLLPPGYLLVRTSRKELRTQKFLQLSGGMLLGVGVAAFYLVPALALERFIFSSEATEGHYNYGNWFLFGGLSWTSGRAEFFWFTLEVAGLAVLAYVIARLNDGRGSNSNLTFWFAVSLVSVFMMTPLSKWIWSALSPLQKIQFPWRFNTVLSLAAATLVGFVFARARRFSLFAFSSVVLCLLSVWAYDLNRRAWFSYPIHYVDSVVVNERTKWLEQKRDQNEVRPRWVVSLREKDLAALLNRVGKTAELPGAAFLDGAGQVEIQTWDFARMTFAVDSTAKATLTISQFYFPGWEARLDNTSELQPAPSIPGGLVSVTVPQGTHIVELKRVWTKPEVTGGVVSVCSLIVLLALLIWPLAFRGRTSQVD